MVPDTWHARFSAAWRSLPDGHTRQDAAALVAASLAELCPGCAVVVTLGVADGSDGLPATGRAGVAPAERDAENIEGTEGTEGIEGTGRRFRVGSQAGVVEIVPTAASGPLDADRVVAALDVVATHLARWEVVGRASHLATRMNGAVAAEALVERAAGYLAEHAHVPVPVAAQALRARARTRGWSLATLCGAVLHGTIDIDHVGVQFPTIDTAHRDELRDRSIARWRRTMADSQTTMSAAAAVVSRSIEARIVTDHERALREERRLGRAVDRHFRTASRRASVRGRPTVILGDDRPPVRAFVLEVLGEDEQVILVGTTDSGGAALALGIVEQPDLIIVGPDMRVLPGSTLLADLRRFCPDSRTLVVVEDLAHPAAPERGARAADPASAARPDRSALGNGVVLQGDGAALRSRVWELCGVRAGP